MTKFATDVSRFLPRFQKLIVQIVGDKIDSASISLESKPAQDFGFDSLTAVSLMFLCEEEFGLDLAPYVTEIAEIEIVGDFLHFIEAKGAT